MNFLWIITGVHVLLTCFGAVFVVLNWRNVAHAAAQYAVWASKLRTLDSDVDDLYDRMKRLQSRKGMQAKRDERSGNPFARVPGETDGEWKARARKLRNQGVAPIAPEEV